MKKTEIDVLKELIEPNEDLFISIFRISDITDNLFFEVDQVKEDINTKDFNKINTSFDKIKEEIVFNYDVLSEELDKSIKIYKSFSSLKEEQLFPVKSWLKYIDLNIDNILNIYSVDSFDLFSNGICDYLLDLYFLIDEKKFNHNNFSTTFNKNNYLYVNFLNTINLIFSNEENNNNNLLNKIKNVYKLDLSLKDIQHKLFLNLCNKSLYNPLLASCALFFCHIYERKDLQNILINHQEKHIILLKNETFLQKKQNIFYDLFNLSNIKYDISTININKEYYQLKNQEYNNILLNKLINNLSSDLLNHFTDYILPLIKENCKNSYKPEMDVMLEKKLFDLKLNDKNIISQNALKKINKI